MMLHGLDRSSCPSCRAVFRGGYQRCPHDGAVLERTDRDPLVGTVLAERYHIESVIGEGGIGRVYRARHVRMSRRYAIKVPFGELAYDAKVRARFMHEAEATSRVQHPNVVGVVDVGETSAGLLYMAMDLAEGISLADVIHREGPMAPARIRRITEQIAEGLGHAHDRGLVHRDLKPENIILERDPGGDERVRLVDFGIAILRDEDGTPHASGRLTTEGIVLGTPHYMSPEQACNQTIDHRTDLFALGLILYEMLAGVLPFDGTPVEVARKNLGADPPRITRRVPGLVADQFLQALAFRLMEKQPERRPQKASEVVELVRLMETDPAQAAERLHLGQLSEIEGEEMSLKPVPMRADIAPARGKKKVRPRLPLPEKHPTGKPKRDGGPELEAPAAAANLVGQDGDADEVSFEDDTRVEVEAPFFDAQGYRVSEQMVEEPRRRWIAPVTIAAALVAAVVLVFAVTRGGASGESARASLPADASPWRPLSPVDAAVPGVDPEPPPPTPIDAMTVIATVETLDAAPRVEEPPRRRKNGTSKVVEKRDPPRQPPDAATATKAPEPADDSPTTASLRKLYEQVGGQLNQLIKARGAEVASTYKRRYEQIPYLEATRKPALRADAMTRLRALSRDLKIAMKG
jgi:serine/threonine-protein kinase